MIRLCRKQERGQEQCINDVFRGYSCFGGRFSYIFDVMIEDIVSAYKFCSAEKPDEFCNRSFMKEFSIIFNAAYIQDSEAGGFNFGINECDGTAVMFCFFYQCLYIWGW